ncbi:MAG: O-antigen ligase family protein [Planctomycetota bacterium]
MTEIPTTDNPTSNRQPSRRAFSFRYPLLSGWLSRLTRPRIIIGVIVLLTAGLAAGQFAWGKAIICLAAIPLVALTALSRHSSSPRRPLFVFWTFLLIIPTAIAIFQTFPVPYSAAVSLSEKRVNWLTDAEQAETSAVRLSYDAYRTRNFALTLLTAVALIAAAGASDRPKKALRTFGAILAVLITILCFFAPIRSIFGDAFRLPGIPISDGRRFVSIFNNPNHFGFFLVVATPVALASLIRWVRFGKRAGSQRGIRYALLVGFGLLAGLCWLLTLSRGAIAAGAFSLAAFAFLSRSAFDWRKETTVAVIGACVAAGLVAFGFDWTKISARFATLDISMSQRLEIWKQTLSLIADHPLTGVGARGFREAFRPYAPVTISGDWPYAHNTILTFASEFGLPALIVLIAAIVIWFRAVGRKYLQLARDNRRNLSSDPFDIILPAAALSAMIGGILAALVDSGPFVPLNLFVLAGISSVGLAMAIKPSLRALQRIPTRRTPAVLTATCAIAALLSGWAIIQSVAVLRAQSSTGRLFSPADGPVSFTTTANGYVVAKTDPLPVDTLYDALEADPLDAVVATEAAKLSVERLRSHQAATRSALDALSTGMTGQTNAERLLTIAKMDALEVQAARQTDALFLQATADTNALARLRPADLLVWNLRAVLAADRIERAVRNNNPCPPDTINDALDAAVRLAQVSTTRPAFSRQATQTALLALKTASSCVSTDGHPAFNAGWFIDARLVAIRLVRQETALAPQSSIIRQRIALFIASGLTADDLDNAFNDQPIARFALLQALADKQLFIDAFSIANTLVKDCRFKPGVAECSYLLTFGVRIGASDLILAALDGLHYLDADGQIALYDTARRASNKPGLKTWLARQLDDICFGDTASVLLRAYHLHQSGASVSARRLLLSPDNAIPEYWKRQVLAEIALALGENETAAVEAQAALNERQGNARSRRAMTDALKPKRATPDMATRNEPTEDSDAALPDVKLREPERRLSDTPAERGSGGRKRLSAWD